MAIDKSLIQGSLAMLILRLLEEKDMYGYELVEEVSKVIDVNEGTIYPLLKRLTNEKYFETYLRESTEGPPRKYYHLTAAGVLYRDELEREWSQLADRVWLFLNSGREAGGTDKEGSHKILTIGLGNRVGKERLDG